MAGTAEPGLQLNPARRSQVRGESAQHPGFAFRQPVRALSRLAAEHELMLRRHRSYLNHHFKRLKNCIGIFYLFIFFLGCLLPEFMALLKNSLSFCFTDKIGLLLPWRATQAHISLLF